MKAYCLSGIEKVVEELWKGGYFGCSDFAA